MSVFRIGTYNVENLFDRFDDPYSVGDDTYGRFRTHPKSRAKLSRWPKSGGNGESVSTEAEQLQKASTPPWLVAPQAPAASLR